MSTDLSSMIILYAPPDLSVEAQWAALAQAATREALARNTDISLDPEVWSVLWNPKPSAECAAFLVSRPLTDEQVGFVVGRERRVSVLETLIAHNDLPRSALEKLLKVKSIAAQVATASLGSELASPGLYDPEFVTELYRVAGGVLLLEQLATGRFSHDDRVELLSCLADWAPKPGRCASRGFRRLLHRDPALLDVFVAPGAGTALLQAAASSQLLVDEAHQRSVLDAALADQDESSRFVLMALGGNPRTHRGVLESLRDACVGDPGRNSVLTNVLRRLEGWQERGTVSDPYEEISDEATLTRLVRRALPYNSSWNNESSPGKPYELVTLAVNPNLSEEQARKIHDVLGEWATSEEVGDDVVVSASQKLVCNFPGLGIEPLEHTPPATGRQSSSSSGGYDYSVPPRDHGSTTVGQVLRANWGLVCEVSHWVGAEASDLPREGWQVLFTLLDSAESDTLGELVTAARSIVSP